MDNLRLLYFEGPDGTGKTTRIKEILNEFDCYWHNGVYPSLDASYSAYSQQIAFLESYPYMSGILDRGIFSDIVYSLVCRNESVSQQNVDALVGRMNAIGTQLIVCLPPYEVCFTNWMERAKRGEEYTAKVDEFQAIYEWYLGLVEYTKMDVFVYDYTGDYSHVPTCRRHR